MSFHHPSVWFLLLLLVLPAMWWRWGHWRRRRAIVFPATRGLVAVAPSLAARLAWVVPALRSAVIVLLILAVARPQVADEHTRVQTDGIAIQLLLDQSGSMEAADYTVDGQPSSRLAAVKRVVAEFVGGGEDLGGRPDDLIGVVAFATYADSLCPLTLDHDHVLRVVGDLAIPAREEERGTALGDAIALGVERIHRLDEAVHEETARRIKGKVMILLTDGENTAGVIDPLEAAMLAEAWDIRIYTIGAGSPDSRIATRDPLTGLTRTMRVSIDEKTLKAIAEATGGEYFRATDSNSLREIYARINELEQTSIRTRRYTDYHELALTPFRLGGFSMPALLPAVFILLALEIVLTTTRLRRLI